MATLTYTKAPQVNIGDKILSHQYNALAKAFNDRINGGAADVAYRIWWYAHSLVRGIRLPMDEYNWPATDEWWKVFGPLNPLGSEQYMWPAEAGPGEPGGANVSNPLAGFVFGQETSKLLSEADRIYINKLDDNVIPTNEYTGDFLKVWNHAKDQRGYINSKPSFQTNAPIYQMSRYLGNVQYSQLSPFLKSYSTFRPTPYSNKNVKCTKTNRLKYSYKFMPLVPGKPILEAGTCQGENGHIQYIHYSENAYILYFSGASPFNDPYSIPPKPAAIVSLLYSDYLETGSTGGGVFTKVKSEHFDQIVNNYICDARGTETELIANSFDIRRTGFNFEKFFTTQFRLSPAVGTYKKVNGTYIATEDMTSYPAFAILPVLKNTEYISEYTTNELNKKTFKRIDATGYRCNNEVVAICGYPYGTPKYVTSSNTTTGYDVQFETIGCLGGYMVAYEGLTKQIAIDIVDCPPAVNGVEQPEVSLIPDSAKNDTIRGIKALWLRAGRRQEATTTSSLPFSLIHYFDSPTRPADRVKVKIIAIDDDDQDAKITFTTSVGFVHVELLQQLYYLPDILDAYTVLRLGSTNGLPSSTGFDTFMYGVNGTAVQTIYDNYYKYGVVHNSVASIGVADDHLNVNSTYESTRKFINDNLRMIPRAQLTGYGVITDPNTNVEKSVLYFRKTIANRYNGIAGAEFTDILYPLVTSDITSLVKIPAKTDLIAGQPYIVSQTTSDLWMPYRAYTNETVPAPYYKVKLSYEPGDYVIYANQTYAPRSVITGASQTERASASFSPTVNVPITLLFNQNGLMVKNKDITAIIAAQEDAGMILPLKLTYDWYTIPEDKPASEQANPNAEVNNGYNYFIYRDAVLRNGGAVETDTVASPNSVDMKSGRYAIQYKYEGGAIYGYYYFNDTQANQADFINKYSQVTYRLQVVPKVIASSSKVKVLPQYNVLPLTLNITGYAANKKYKIVRLTGPASAIVEKVLVAYYQAQQYTDALNDVDVYTSNVAGQIPGITKDSETQQWHRVYWTTDNGTTWTKGSFTYAERHATVWYDSVEKQYLGESQLVPYATTYTVGTTDYKAVVAYRVTGENVEGNGVSYQEFTYYQDIPSIWTTISKSVNARFVWGSATMAELLKMVSLTNKDLRTTGNVKIEQYFAGLFSEQYDIDAILGDNPANYKNYNVLHKEISTYSWAGPGNAIGGSLQASIPVENQIGTALPTALSVYKLYSGKERVAFSNGTGIVENSNYLVKSNNTANYVTYNNQKYCAGETFIGGTATTYDVSDPSVVIFLVESNLTGSSNFEIFGGMLGKTVMDGTATESGDTYADHSDHLLTSDDYTDSVVYAVTTGSVTYKEAGATKTVGAGGTFVWNKDCSLFKRVNGTEPVVIQINGIIKKAPRNGTSNEWSMFAGFNHYNPSNSSVWKTDNYGDILPVLHNRCHVDSYNLGYKEKYETLRNQFAYGNAPIMVSEASPGYTYLDGVIGTNASRDFFSSCQIYTPPAQLESVKLLPAQSTDSICTGGMDYDQVVMTFTGRLQHAKITTSSTRAINAHIGAGTTASWTALKKDLELETYRTDENGIREYLCGIIGNGLHNQFPDNLATPGYECRRGLIGDQAPDGDLYHSGDSPFGCCHPRFYFIRNVRKVYQDNNDTVDLNIDSHMLAYDFRVMEFYLRAMCGGFLNLAATKVSDYCVEGYEDSFYADYTFEELCYQGMQQLAVPKWVCGEDAECTVEVNKPPNEFAVSAVGVRFQFSVPATLHGTSKPVALYANSVTFVTVDEETSVSFEDGGWRTVEAAFLTNPAGTQLEFTTTLTWEGKQAYYTIFQLKYDDDVTIDITGYVIGQKHILYFPFLASETLNTQRYGYSYQTTVVSANTGQITINNWTATTTTFFDKEHACKDGCTYYTDYCKTLPDSCAPTGNIGCANVNCSYTIESVNAKGLLGTEMLDKPGFIACAVSYNVIDTIDVESNIVGSESNPTYTLNWPMSYGSVYDVYVSFATTTPVPPGDWAKLTADAKSPITYRKSDLIETTTEDVTDYVEYGGLVLVPNRTNNPTLVFPKFTPNIQSDVDTNGVTYYYIAGEELIPDVATPGAGLEKAPSVALIVEPADRGETTKTIISQPRFNNASPAVVGGAFVGARILSGGVFTAINVKARLVLGLPLNVTFNDLTAGEAYVVTRTDTIETVENNQTTSIATTITVGEIYAPAGNTSASIVDPFDYDPRVTKMEWAINTRDGVSVGWHTAEEINKTGIKYYAYLLDTSKPESDAEPYNPKKLIAAGETTSDVNLKTFTSPTTFPATLNSVINSTNPEYRQVYMQAEWTKNTGEPKFQIRVRPALLKNRRFSPLTMALRYDRPKGFGMVPYTCAYAEMFNYYSGCINLLTKCRVDLPVTYQYRLTEKTSCKTVPKITTGVVVGAGDESTYWFDRVYRGVGEQTGWTSNYVYTQTEHSNWTSIVLNATFAELIGANKRGVHESNTYATRLREVNNEILESELLNITTKQFIEFKVVLGEVVKAIPDILQNLVGKNVLITIAEGHNPDNLSSTVTQKISEASDDDPNCYVRNSDGTYNYGEPPAEVITTIDDPSNPSVKRITKRIKYRYLTDITKSIPSPMVWQQVIKDGKDRSKKVLLTTTEIYSPAKCTTFLNKIALPPTPAGDLLYYTAVPVNGSVFTVDAANISGLSYTRADLSSILFYIDVPFTAYTP
jgi:hypothetical protein